MCSNGSHVDLLAGPLNVTEPWHGCCRPLKHDGKPDKKCSTVCRFDSREVQIRNVLKRTVKHSRKFICAKVSAMRDTL